MADQDEAKGDGPELWEPTRGPGPMPEVLRKAPPEVRKPVDMSDMQARTARMGAIGTNFVVSVIAAGFLGWLVDRWQGTKPWGLLVGMLLGLGYGFHKFIKEALAANRPQGK